ncbi:MAG: hypothetical protein IPL61_36545 [Myxococcales bacterium]|nr:hypothetical protein [Myxococcales bacterium]
MRAAAVLLALTLALTPTRARADDDKPIRPDPRAVAAAREANLEPESAREGFAIGIAVGPAIQLGYGVGNATGGGGGFDLRLGSVASKRWVWLLELAATAFPHDGTANQSAVVTFGGQLYVHDAFWLRGGAGFASFTRRDAMDAQTEQFGGLGGSGAAGFDLVRRGGLAMSAEGMSTVALYSGALVVGVSLQLGLSWY